ncbi:hypothetical protein ACFO25_08520 [Paenactinomyces guangxiensis]|uniref:Uncharacterized protein n=1 Tax=Paenactinomyces guangxiensis TaxID=1490290 RepID=A0A7W1WN82_9BACL|nr:hypothetical protein [Paenactinomyces guangxiensis]MBA4492911.1 hypothetical protein [Paenactinomyces guangxiensis]MBH8590240.1 hypothetical protein [Paenactinomyces guangxiensis]
MKIPDVSYPIGEPEIYTPTTPEILTPRDPEPDRREDPHTPDRSKRTHERKSY